MTKEEKKRYCSGCNSNIYNLGVGGTKECWCLSSARLVMRKEVHIDQVPPWKQKPIKVLSCYNKRRFVYVGPDREY